MALEVEEVLSLWREAERLLDGMPANAPDRTIVSAEVVNLKRIYRRLTADSDATAEILSASHMALESAQATLDSTRRRLDARL
jgi:hypothetical protein